MESRDGTTEDSRVRMRGCESDGRRKCGGDGGGERSWYKCGEGRGGMNLYGGLLPRPENRKGNRRTTMMHDDDVRYMYASLDLYRRWELNCCHPLSSCVVHLCGLGLYWLSSCGARFASLVIWFGVFISV